LPSTATRARSRTRECPVDGQHGCFDCGGTGLRSLREYRFEADAKLAKGQREAELYLMKVREVRASLSADEV